jgi:hypothetical protein
LPPDSKPDRYSGWGDVVKAAMKGLLPIEDLSVDEKTILDDMEQHPLGLDG